MTTSDKPGGAQRAFGRQDADFEAARVTLYTRVGCHLCEVAAGELVGAGVAYTEIDITADRDLEVEYGDSIPVIMLDGREHGYWRVEIARLLRDMSQ